MLHLVLTVRLKKPTAEPHPSFAIYDQSRSTSHAFELLWSGDDYLISHVAIPAPPIRANSEFTNTLCDAVL